LLFIDFLFGLIYFFIENTLNFDFIYKIFEKYRSNFRTLLSDDGKYTIKIQKFNEGENFENLDMIVKMLEKSKVEKRNLIEPMSDEEMDEEENIETWEIEQKVENSEILENSSYGFANREADIFQKISEEAVELFDKIDIAKIENKKRTELRIEFEEK